MPRGGVEERATVEGCRSELGKVERQIDSTVNTIADGMYHSSMKLKMDSLEDWKAKLIEPLANPEEPPTLLHPNMVEIYRSRSSLRIPDLIRVRTRRFMSRSLAAVHVRHDAGLRPALSEPRSGPRRLLCHRAT